MPHVLVPQPIHADAVALLRAAPGVTVELLPALTAAALDAALPRAQALIVRGSVVDAAVAERAPGLRIVARHGVGYDLIDVPAMTARGIAVTITPEANAGSVAEHALMLMLACARRVLDYDRRARGPEWGVTPALPTLELAGRSVLVLGFGRIGARVARLCAAFGMRVLVHDPFLPPGTLRGAGHLAATDLRAALAEADLVTLHVPAHAANRGLVDAGFLAAMRRGAILINTARGALIDEAALAAALRDGQVGAAGLDVLRVEPAAADNPLLAAPHLILSPHGAASTVEGTRRMAIDAARCVLDCFAGCLPAEAMVNPELLRR